MRRFLLQSPDHGIRPLVSFPFLKETPSTKVFAPTRTQSFWSIVLFKSLVLRSEPTCAHNCSRQIAYSRASHRLRRVFGGGCSLNTVEPFPSPFFQAVDENKHAMPGSLDPHFMFRSRCNEARGEGREGMSQANAFFPDFFRESRVQPSFIEKFSVEFQTIYDFLTF